MRNMGKAILVLLLLWLTGLHLFLLSYDTFSADSQIRFTIGCHHRACPGSGWIPNLQVAQPLSKLLGDWASGSYLLPPPQPSIPVSAGEAEQRHRPTVSADYWPRTERSAGFNCSVLSLRSCIHLGEYIFFPQPHTSLLRETVFLPVTPCSVYTWIDTLMQYGIISVMFTMCTMSNFCTGVWKGWVVWKVLHLHLLYMLYTHILFLIMQLL